MQTEWFIIGGIIVLLIVFGVIIVKKNSSGGGGGPKPAPPEGVRLTTGGSSGYVYTLEWDASSAGTPPISYAWALYPANQAQNPVSSGTTQNTSVSLSTVSLKAWTTYYAQVTATNKFGSAPSALVPVQTQGAPVISGPSVGYRVGGSASSPQLMLYGQANSTISDVSSTVSIDGASPIASSSCAASESSQMLSDLIALAQTTPIIFSGSTCNSPSTINSAISQNQTLANVVIYAWSSGFNGFQYYTTATQGGPVAVLPLSKMSNAQQQGSLAWYLAQNPSAGCVYAATGSAPGFSIQSQTPVMYVFNGQLCPTDSDCTAAAGSFACLWQLPSGTSVGSGSTFAFEVTVSNQYGSAESGPFNFSIAGTPPSSPSNIKLQ
jgi:hypothetical protein